MKKKILSFALAGSLMLGLTGCGQKSDPNPGSKKGYDEGEQYVSIWVHSIEDTDEGRAYRQSVNAFNKKYNGKYFADIEFIPRNDSGGGYTDKINASVMSGGLPDVLTVDGPNISSYAHNNIIAPLVDVTKKEKSEYLNSIIEQGTVDGKLYALGAMESSVGLYYNKDILDKAGVTVPDQDHPWTFSEFLNVLEKVKKVTDQSKGYPLDMTFPTGEATIYYYAPFFWSNGGNLVSKDGLKVDGIFNSEKNTETVEYFKKLRDNGYMSKVAIANLFEEGRAAFKFDGAWEVNTVRTQYKKLKLGIAPYIVGDSWNHTPYTPTGSWAFAMSSKAKNKVAASTLVKYMSGEESGLRLYKMTKSFPSTYKAFESVPDFTEDPLYSKLYYQLKTYGHPRPKTPVYPQVSTSFQQVLENTVLSGEDVKTQQNRAVERINAKMKRYTM